MAQVLVPFHTTSYSWVALTIILDCTCWHTVRAAEMWSDHEGKMEAEGCVARVKFVPGPPRES